MNKKNIQSPSKSVDHSLIEKPSSNVGALVKTEVMGVGLTNAANEEILEYLNKFLTKTQEKLYIVTPNPEMIVLASKNNEFKKTLNYAQIALCDGMQLYRAAQFFGKKLKTRINGTNFMEMLCKKSVDWPITVGFLGGKAGIAVECAECLITKYPGLRVKFAGESLEKNEWRDKKVDSIQYKVYSGENKKSKKKILNTKFSILDTKVDILFVAYGFPKQEFFMRENLEKLPVRVMMGVGGAFDQIVNPSLRPPKFMDSIGFGWLYRLIRQPWRIKRQLTLIEFIFLVIKEKLK